MSVKILQESTNAVRHITISGITDMPSASGVSDYFSPRHVLIKQLDGNRHAVVSGPNRKRDGTLGQRDGERHFKLDNADDSNYAPAWLTELAGPRLPSAREAWDAGFTACHKEHTEQRKDATRPINRNNPYAPTAPINADHDPCCSTHQVAMTCERYRRTHFVTTGNCCQAWAKREEAGA